MILNDLVDVIDKEDSLFIKFWDPNMNMTREISQDNLSTFIRSNGNAVIKRIIPGNYKITVEIVKP